jgi:hypothetical protein
MYILLAILMAQAGGLNKVLCWNTTKTALLNETAG